jgi:hypothetical protein
MGRKMTAPSFDQFVQFVREFHPIPHKMAITPATRFEYDLGITGNDGIDLLEATEKQFGVTLGSEEHGVRQIFTSEQTSTCSKVKVSICSVLFQV